jgi:hypothetical protein
LLSLLWRVISPFCNLFYGSLASGTSLRLRVEPALLLTR